MTPEADLVFPEQTGAELDRLQRLGMFVGVSISVIDA
jgi:hypothetical protein